MHTPMSWQVMFVVLAVIDIGTRIWFRKLWVEVVHSDVNTSSYTSPLSVLSYIFPCTADLLLSRLALYLLMNNVPTPLEYLEYDEEDDQDDNIFGSDHEDGGSASRPSSVPTFNTAKPLSANRSDFLVSDPSSSSSRKGKERARAKDPQDRLDELRFMRLPKPTQGKTGQGVRSLRDVTMSGPSIFIVVHGRMSVAHASTVIKQNSTRIWDIGDLEYRVIADFLHELPMEQLAEIEGSSPVRIITLTCQYAP